jgi:PAS domain S-box-containing protein
MNMNVIVGQSKGKDLMHILKHKSKQELIVQLLGFLTKDQVEQQGSIRDVTYRKEKKALALSRKEMALRNRIDQILLTRTDDEMYGDLLEVLLKVMKSNFGVFGYIDEHGTFVAPSMTRNIWEECSMPHKTMYFPRETWRGEAIWARALLQKKSLFMNEEGKVPKGHLAVHRALMVPILYRGELIGIFQFANKGTDYTNEDVEEVEKIADYVAPVLHARLQRDFEERRRKQVEAQLRQSEERLQLALKGAEQGIWDWDLKTKAILLDDCCREIFGLPPDASVTYERSLQTLHPDDRQRVLDATAIALRDRSEFGEEFRTLRPDGTTRWVLARGRGFCNDAGDPYRMCGTVLDITARKLREQRIVRLTKLYAVLSRVDEMIVRTHDEERLYEEVCQIIAEEGEFPLVWVGQVKGRQVVPAASHGPATNYLKEIRVEVNGELGNGPTGTCIREDRPVANEDFDTNPSTAPWRKPALRYGFRASAAFPVHRQGRIVGTLTLYASDPGAFDTEQVNLLEALCADISYALGAMQQEKLRTEAENALRKRTFELQQLTETLEQRVQERTAELEKANEALRYLSSKLLSAQEEERKRIAAEIHDTFGACLAAIKFKVEMTVRQKGEIPNGAIESLETVIPVIQEGIDECRRMQMDLRPSMLDDLGLLPTLSWFCRRYQTIYSGIRVNQEMEIEETEVPDSLKIVVYRITQEAMNNIAKHSKADLVRLSLRKIDRRMELVLEDNGQGFDLEKVVGSEGKRQGLGLSSMRERTDLSGGFLGIESTEGKGTIIRVWWPLHEMAQSKVQQGENQAVESSDR